MPSDNGIMRYYRETEQRQIGRRLTREEILALSRKILADAGMVPRQAVAQLEERRLGEPEAAGS